jgi:hypothetical protein
MKMLKFELLGRRRAFSARHHIGDMDLTEKDILSLFQVANGEPKQLEIGGSGVLLDDGASMVTERASS